VDYAEEMMLGYQRSLPFMLNATSYRGSSKRVLVNLSSEIILTLKLVVLLYQRCYAVSELSVLSYLPF